MEEKRQPSAANVPEGAGSLSGYFPWPRPRQAEPTTLGSNPIRRRQRRVRGNLPGPEGLARRGASAALHGLPVVTTTGGAARLASAPSPCQRGSREILRQ